MSIKDLTMKSEYLFRVIHPKHVLKMRRKYKNSSLTKKLAWRADIKKWKEQWKAFPDLFREDGGIDIFAVCARTNREQKDHS